MTLAINFLPYFVSLSRYVKWFIETEQPRKEAENMGMVSVSTGIGNKIRNQVLKVCWQRLNIHRTKSN